MTAPAEDRVTGDVHPHVQVARRAAALARGTLALELDPLSVRDVRSGPWMVRALMARPLPPQVAHGSSTTRPRPRQVVDGSENAKLPRSRLDWPVPSQVGQTFGTVPAFAPVPRQTLHGPSSVSRRVTVEPSMASLKVSEASVSTSAPRRGLA